MIYGTSVKSDPSTAWKWVCFELLSLEAAPSWSNLDPDQFIEGVEPERILREMYLVSEGYLWEIQKKGSLDIDEDIEKIEADFHEMIAFWKKIYLRKMG